MSSVSSLNSLLSSASASSSSAVNLSSLLAAATGATSTGIDVNAAVEAAVYAAQAPERQWQAQQATVQSQITALSSIKTAATQVSTDLTSLADPLGALAARSVSSSNAAAATATASAGASTGTHVLTVGALATAASWYSPLVASAGSSLGSSVLTVSQANGTKTSFSLGSTNSTLSTLVSSINAANLGITASVIQDASGARLALVGNSTGSSADFTVSDDSSSAVSWSSADLASSSAQLASSTFQVTAGGQAFTVSVKSGSTLADVADQINSQGSDILASVVTDSSGVHLNVASNMGENVTVSSDPTLVLTQAAHAQNASLTVDGVPISSQSNTVSGAISGVTLNLLSATQGAQVTLAVTPDTSSVSKAISQFVTDYNSTLSLVSSQFQYSSSTSSQGVLGSDATLRTLQSSLLGVGSYTASSKASGVLPTLANLGISMGDDGTLSLNSEVLDQAITNSPEAVQQFFQGASRDGFANHFKTGLQTFVSPGSGAFTSELSNLTKQYNDLQANVDNYESGYVASQKTLLTSMYSKAEIALQSLPTTLKQLQAELSNGSGS